MKRYLLVGIALLFVSANASLKEDFVQMDLDEEQLLSDMRKSAALSGNIDEEEKKDTSAPEQIEKSDSASKEESVVAPSPESTENMADSVGAVTSELDSVVNENDTEESEDTIHQKAMAEAKEKDETQKALAAKDEALKIEIDAKEAEIKNLKEAEEKAAVEQREAEQREVEAYEKQRAEKLAKEASEEAAKKEELEKKQLAQEALEKEEAAKEKSMAKAAAEETKIVKTTEPAEEVSTVGDVNVARELEEKTQVANEEYENAIKEMQEED